MRAACHELAASARREITALVGGTPICPDSSHWFGQMCAIPLPVDDAPALQKRLREEWHIEVPIFPWNDLRLLRISLQGYNGPDDVERLVRVLEAVFSDHRAPF